jgi:hypothetical protein
MAEPLFPLIVENMGRTRARYMIQGRLGSVEFMPGAGTLTLMHPTEPGTIEVYRRDTAAFRRAAVILDEAGQDALRDFLTTWYYELPDLLSSAV